LNIFAFLFFVTFVKTTKKVSTYEDIVQSFVQIKQDLEVDSSAKVSEIFESFTESNKQLQEFQSAVESTCSHLEESNNAFSENNQKKLKALAEDLENLTNQSNALQNDIDSNLTNQEEENKKIQESQNAIKNAKDELHQKEMELVETIQVLHRLRNLAQDELAGNTKLETKMKDFSVVNEHGVSFIQKSNLKEELKNIVGKAQTAEKSLISSLILLASSDDGHYADPAAVQKILDVLDRILKSNEDRKAELQTEFENNVSSHSALISASEELLQNLKENAMKNQNQLESNSRLKLMYEDDITQHTTAGERRQKRFDFQKGICDKHRENAARNVEKYERTVEKLNELRSDLP